MSESHSCELARSSTSGLLRKLEQSVGWRLASFAKIDRTLLSSRPLCEWLMRRKSQRLLRRLDDGLSRRGRIVWLFSGGPSSLRIGSWRLCKQHLSSTCRVWSWQLQEVLSLKTPGRNLLLSFFAYSVFFLHIVRAQPFLELFTIFARGWLLR